MLQAWSTQLLNDLGVKEIDWMDKNLVNEDAFREYRVAKYNPYVPIVPISITPVNPMPPATRSNANKYSLAQEFRKGIKRDKSHYEILKNEKLWDDWKGKSISTIHAHNCANVIDPTYLPSTPEEKELFQEQNTYIYDILNTILQTTMGNHFVR